MILYPDRPYGKPSPEFLTSPPTVFTVREEASATATCRFFSPFFVFMVGGGLYLFKKGINRRQTTKKKEGKMNYINIISIQHERMFRVTYHSESSAAQHILVCQPQTNNLRPKCYF